MAGGVTPQVKRRRNHSIRRCSVLVHTSKMLYGTNKVSGAAQNSIFFYLVKFDYRHSVSCRHRELFFAPMCKGDCKAV